MGILSGQCASLEGVHAFLEKYFSIINCFENHVLNSVGPFLLLPAR